MLRAALRIDIEEAAARWRRAGNLAKMGHRRIGMRQIDGREKSQHSLNGPGLVPGLMAQTALRRLGVPARISRFCFELRAAQVLAKDVLPPDVEWCGRADAHLARHGRGR